MAHSVKKNTLFVSIGQFTQIALAFVLVPFAARYLGDEGFGQYSLATAIMYIVFLVNDFGLNTLTIRENARHREHAAVVFGNAIFVKLVFIVLCVIVLLISLWIYELPREAEMAAAIFAIYGVLTSMGQLATGVFRSFERMEYETIVVVLEKAIITGLGVYFLILGNGLVMFSMVFVAGGMATLVVSLFIIHRKFFPVRLHVDVKRSQAILKQSLILGLSMFLVTIYDRVAVLLLGAMKSAQVIGWYSAAYKLISLTSVIPTIIVTATFPKLARESQMRQEVVAAVFTKGIKYLLFLALPLIAGVSILAAPLINLVYGSEYSQAIPALRILVLTSAFNFMNIFLAGLFWATDNQRRMFVFQAVALVINIALNLVLIPGFGHIGSAWASVATEGIVFVLAFYIAVTKISRIEEGRFVVKAIGATSVMSAFLMFVPSINIFVSVMLSMAVYFTSLFLFRGFAFDEIISFRQRSMG